MENELQLEASAVVPPLESIALESTSDLQDGATPVEIEINEASTRSFGTLLEKNDFCSRLTISSKQYKKSFILAVLLFFTGTILLGIGIHCLLACTPERHGIIFLVSGSLAFMPGFYGTLVFIQHARRVRGYDPQDLERKWQGI